jgi:hypothetical protein
MEEEMGRACSTHGRDKKCTQDWSENLKGRDHVEDVRLNGNIIFEWILGKLSGKLWSGCIWLRIGTNSGPL